MFEEFVEHLRTQDRSENTVSGYLRDLEFFAGWFRGTNHEDLAPQVVTPLDLREYRAHLRTVKKQAGSTINRKLAAVRAWLAWAEKEGYIEVNPAQSIKGVRLDRPRPRWLTRKETYALLRELQKAEQLAAARAGGDEGHPAVVQARRDVAVVALLLHAGLRVGELVALEVGDVEVSERKGQVTVRYGKGGKERVVPLNTDARQAVEDWLAVRQGFVLKGKGDHLFFGKGRQPLSERGVQYLVSKYATAAGLESCSPHTLRHSFGKALADAGVGLERIAALMGHESLETTRIYTVPSTQDLASAVERIAWSDQP
jgi:site-specific recombinase XerD